MKCALVIDWPAIDAPKGHLFSEWEGKVVSELLATARFKPGLIRAAASRHAQRWEQLWEGGKIGGQLVDWAEADRQALLKELEGYDMVLAMGSHAMWCLTGETKLDTFRGTHMDSPYVEGVQVVPTYAPVIFCRMAWNERPTVLAAIRKATKRFEEIDRTIYLPDCVADLYAFSTQHIGDEIVFDVETNSQTRITEFSVAPSSKCCLYVQLEDRNAESVWSEKDELDIWLWLHFLAVRKDLSWGFHNATYDLTYLDAYGIRPRGHIFDTMLRHHAWQPEWEKSLGFLASLHIPTRAWKHLRTKAKKDFNKAGSL